MSTSAKTLTPEQEKEWRMLESGGEKAEATLKEQSAELQREYDELLKEMGEQTDPELKEQLSQIAERTKKSLDAVEQAIACLLNNPS